MSCGHQAGIACGVCHRAELASLREEVSKRPAIDHAIADEIGDGGLPVSHGRCCASLREERDRAFSATREAKKALEMLRNHGLDVPRDLYDAGAAALRAIDEVLREGLDEWLDRPEQRARVQIETERAMEDNAFMRALKGKKP